MYFLRSLPPAMIVGGDFNSVMKNTDCTGNINFSKDLEKIVSDIGLVDVWETVPPRAVYTHYTSHGAARLDRINVASKLSCRKVRVETFLRNLQIA